jgi:DNA-nicking Smr family endonuclease
VSKKTFDVHDHALWDEVKKTFSPMRGRPRSQHALVHPKTVVPANTVASSRPRVRDVTVRQNPPPLAPFDRRLAQRLLRGQVEPDARLDLHGHTVESARMVLLHFLHAQQQSGSRIVLVITGKGGPVSSQHTLHGVKFFHMAERQGRLRSEVPEFLHEAPFRSLVMGFQPAHPRHGGGGAIYVGLRRYGMDR